jgi:uncharacterized membrane protein
LAFLAFPKTVQGAQPGAMVPAELVELMRVWPLDDTDKVVQRLPLATISRGLATNGTPSGQTAFASFANITSYPPAFYLPQAIGLALAHSAGLPPLAQFYAGRLSGGLVAIVLMLAALRIMPDGRRTLLSVLVLPGVAIQLASYSADSIIFSLIFLTLALLLRRVRTGASGFDWPSLVLVPIVALAKGVYMPLALAAMGSLGALRPRALASLAVVLLAGVGVFALWYGVISAGDITPQHYVSSRTLEHAVSASPQAQLLYIEAHPAAALSALMGTAIRRAPVYVIECIGRFGGFKVLLPIPLYLLGCLMVAAGVVETNAQAQLPTTRQRLVWLGIVALVIFLVHAALYLTATALGEPVVEAVSGRYMIPTLPLLLYALRVRLPALPTRIATLAWPVAAVALMFGGLATAAAAFWQI